MHSEERIRVDKGETSECLVKEIASCLATLHKLRLQPRKIILNRREYELLLSTVDLALLTKIASGEAKARLFGLPIEVDDKLARFSIELEKT